jgi:hypothetical protein
MRDMKITRESWILAAIGIADLVTTIVFIEHHGAEEANPLFRHFWNMGLPAFILAKLVLLACPLFILEWARKRSPRFTIRALRGGIAAYILMYGIGFARLNGPEAHANEVQPLNVMGAPAMPSPMSLVSWKLSTEEMARLPYEGMYRQHRERMNREEKRQAWEHIQRFRNKRKLIQTSASQKGMILNGNARRFKVNAVLP